MACDVVVNFRKVLVGTLAYGNQVNSVKSNTHRHKETRGAVVSIEHSRKQMQPCIITIHDKSASRPCL